MREIGDKNWLIRLERFLVEQFADGAGRSSLDGMNTLYGTVYTWMALYYLGKEDSLDSSPLEFLSACQDSESGLLIGPELQRFKEDGSNAHDLDHLKLHSTCSALPLYRLLGISLEPIKAAHEFCDPEYLSSWLTQRDWKDAWKEGNNILFVGQLLEYLRDVESNPAAAPALEQWFQWLEAEADEQTSLWGTNGHCSNAAAVYGGYHQLLVYWYEGREIPNPEGLVDTVLGLRHPDGGFNPKGNAGACEDVDSVDILVHCYKRWDYRRAEIRCALRACADHILATQNPDGGFPYKRNAKQSHMGIPGTDAGPNESCTFPTWFRIHTLALCAEVIPEHPALRGLEFRFNPSLSMGWHDSPAGWNLELNDDQLNAETRIAREYIKQRQAFELRERFLGKRSLVGRVRRRLKF